MTRWKRATVPLTFLLTFSCLLSCSSGKSEIQKEADGKAQQWWDSAVAKCGDYYYRYQGIDMVSGKIIHKDILYQFKPTTFIVKEMPVTAASELNGVEWSGQIIVPVSAYRYYDLGGNYNLAGWYGWLDGAPQFDAPYLRENAAPVLGAVLEKVKGKWSVDGQDYVKPNCSEIPKDTPK